jgi:hypothetical protein
MTMETTAHRPSKESKAFDSDRATSHPPTASFIRARAARADLSQDDPIPLFLSDPLGAPDPGEYAPIEVRSRIVPRVLAAVLTASTLAILVTLYQSDFRGLFPANAVSWMGIAPEQAMASANTPAMTQSSLKDSDRPTRWRAPTRRFSLHRQRRAAKRSRPPIRRRCKPRHPYLRPHPSRRRRRPLRPPRR